MSSTLPTRGTSHAPTETPAPPALAVRPLSTRKGRYMAAPISAMGRQRWPRTFIHADMATVMFVAMISAPV